MITGHIDQWDRDKLYLPKAFDTAVAYLAGQDPLLLEPGRYAIDGERIFVNIERPCTAPLAERRYELHRDHIDIQVLFQGREMHWYGLCRPQEAPTEDLLAERDVAFYPPPQDARPLPVQPMQYVIYLPYEPHCPICTPEGEQPGQVFKAIFKIHRSCLKG